MSKSEWNIMLWSTGVNGHVELIQLLVCKPQLYLTSRYNTTMNNRSYNEYRYIDSGSVHEYRYIDSGSVLIFKALS